MFYSGKEKLFDDDGNAPAGIKQQFAGTFVDTFPGTDAAWVILGILEFGVFLLLVASLLRLEFLPHREKWFLQVGLAVALLTFACLAFGQTATKQFAGTASALHVLRLDGRDPHPREPACRRTARIAGSEDWGADRTDPTTSSTSRSRAARYSGDGAGALRR